MLILSGVVFLYSVVGHSQVAASQESCLSLAKSSVCGSNESEVLSGIQLLCESQKAIARCDEIYLRATPAERRKFIDCEKPEDLCSVIMAPIESCGLGAKKAVVEFASSLIQLPARMMEEALQISDRFQTCGESEAGNKAKLSLMGVFRPKDMSEASIAHMSCSDVQKFVEGKTQTLLERVNERLLKRKTETGDEAIQLVDLALSEQEQAALLFDLSRRAPYRQAACYNRTEKIKFICGEVTSVALSTASGAAIGAASGIASRAVGPLLLRGAKLPLPSGIARRIPKGVLRRTVSGSQRKYQVLDEKGREVALLDIEIANGNLEVREVFVNSDLRRHGAARLLLEQALADHPSVTGIRTFALVQTNLDVVNQARAAKLTQEQAIRSTPAYKIRARLGFTEIVPESITPDNGFTVRRPYPESSRINGDALAGSGVSGPALLVIPPEVEQSLSED